TQLSILGVVNAVGAAPPGALAKRLGMERTTLLRNLRPLVRRKLLEVGREKGSVRTEVRATRAGKAAVARAYHSWRRTQDRVLAVLPDRTFVRTLELLATDARKGRE